MRLALVLLGSCLLAACSGDSSPPPAAPTPQSTPKPAHGSNDSPPAGGIVLGTLDGRDRPLADLRARVTVIAMWASYCAPCVRELHLIQALHARYRDSRDVAVLLVSVDEFEPDSRAAVQEILADKALTVPAFIDTRRQLIERVAPRDASGKAHYTVPMLVVVDEAFGVRRKLGFDQSDEAAFLAGVTPLIDAALRGDPIPPEKPYEAGLGSSFTRRSITLEVPRLTDNQIAHYVAEYRRRVAEMFPDLDDHQLDEVMAEIEEKLHIGGTFEIVIPPPH